MIFKLIGAIIFLTGAAALTIGLQGIDPWSRFGISLPAKVEEFAPYIALVVGAIIFALGSSGKKSPQRF